MSSTFADINFANQNYFFGFLLSIYFLKYLHLHGYFLELIKMETNDSVVENQAGYHLLSYQRLEQFTILGFHDLSLINICK